MEDNQEPLQTINELDLHELLSKASENGYTYEDVLEWCESIGYTEIKDLNQWDYEDCLKNFSTKKVKDAKQLKV